MIPRSNISFRELALSEVIHMSTMKDLHQIQLHFILHLHLKIQYEHKKEKNMIHI